MIHLYIYLIGFVISYILLRTKGPKNFTANNWESITMSFIASTMSWLTILILGVHLLMDSDAKPPKWL